MPFYFYILFLYLIYIFIRPQNLSPLIDPKPFFYIISSRNIFIYFDCIIEILCTLVSSSNHKPRKYASVVDQKLLEDETLYELTFNDIRFVGCSYFVHRKRQRHSTMYVIPCEYTLKNDSFRKLFNGEHADLSKGTIIHHCHKVCDNCLQKFKKEKRRCKLCPKLWDVDYKLHCKPMLNLWNCRDFIIQTLSDYDVIVEGCKKFIDNNNNNLLLGLIVQCEVRHISALYKFTVEALKLPTEITMDIAYSNIFRQHNIVFNTKPYWDMEKYNNDNYKWEDVFQDEHLVSTISSPLVIFDGVKITSNTKTLKLDYVILIYISKMLDEGTYGTTLRLANVYYEGAPLYGNRSKQKAQNSHRGFYKNISHAYTSNVGIASGNVVPYHSSKVSVHEEKAFKDIGDEITSNI
jgi:hypothetical protein